MKVTGSLESGEYHVPRKEVRCLEKGNKVQSGCFQMPGAKGSR